MRVGILGGSFDPVHFGHLRLAECCLEQASLDWVELIPAAQQPHKPQGPVAPAADRLAMLRLAVGDSRSYQISTMELDRGGPSYTVETLRQLHRRRSEDELYFLMGADSLADFPNWREPAEICRLATLLVVRRAGAPEPDFAALRAVASSQRVEEYRSAQVEMPDTPISSSQIRQLIAEGRPWESLTPAPVADYIKRHGLYGSG